MKIHVVGAGFSGLSTAYFLLHEGFEVEVYEKSSEVAGLLKTQINQFGLAEPAANAFISSDDLEKLCADIGVNLISTLKTAKKRFIFRDGKMRRWPLYFFESVVFIWKLALSLLTGSFSPKDQETVAKWGQRVFGISAVENLLAPALQGIYAGDVYSMRADLVVRPLLLSKKNCVKPKIKGSVSFSGGMREVCEKLYLYLKKHGVLFHFNSSFDFSVIKAGEKVVVATSAKSAQEILVKKDPEMCRKIDKIYKSNVVSATCFYQAQNAPEGFGCLFKPKDHFNSLGVLFNRNIFSNRTPSDEYWSETWIMGGYFNPQAVELSDAELLEKIEQDRAVIFPEKSFKSQFLKSEIFRWREVLPHYDHKMDEFLKYYESSSHEYYLTGNYVGSLGLTKILSANKVLAKKIKRDQHGS